MDTSQYNASLQPGEKPVGSGAGTPKPAAEGAPVGKKISHAEHLAAQDKRRNDAELIKTFQGIDEAFETQRIERLAHERAIELHRQDRARMEAIRERSNEPRDRSLDETVQDKLARETANAQPKQTDAKQPEAKQPEAKQPESKPNSGIDPALMDPWDLPADKREPVGPEAEGFDQYRNQKYRGHAITPPEAILVNAKVAIEDVHSAASDVGIAARRDGVSAEGAQAFFETIAHGYQPPSGETFDFDTGRQQMLRSMR